MSGVLFLVFAGFGMASAALTYAVGGAAHVLILAIAAPVVLLAILAYLDSIAEAASDRSGGIE